ncbi:hypothetical protein [Synechococcus sp. CCY9202]|uniref:hypothetical protein n=1 Tax=Synechococcus sp. CCY9202 TaxID=174698 RepID=UPI002B20718F|nr:hypothetical protein [Synechococcus sp. CCY9202]MEA5424073.1 hypothetical protein [Synechococcus sp. CCY9202]CAK6691925.1 hypothetical protein IFHNHDMJ_01114 [Synechococcus sp. CBW1107]
MDHPPPATASLIGALLQTTPEDQKQDGLDTGQESLEEPPSPGLIQLSLSPILGFTIALATVLVPLGSVMAQRPTWLPSAAAPGPAVTIPLRETGHGSQQTGGLSGTGTGQSDR